MKHINDDVFICPDCGSKTKLEGLEFKFGDGEKHLKEDSVLTCPVCKSEFTISALMTKKGSVGAGPEEFGAPPEEEAPEETPDEETPAGGKASPATPTTGLETGGEDTGLQIEPKGESAKPKKGAKQRITEALAAAKAGKSLNEVMLLIVTPCTVAIPQSDAPSAPAAEKPGEEPEPEDEPDEEPEDENESKKLSEGEYRVVEQEDIERLTEIKDEIKELIHEAQGIIRDTHEADRAESYWIPHILSVLDKDHSYLGGFMTTMQDTIDKLEQGMDDEDEDEGDEEPKAEDGDEGGEEPKAEDEDEESEEPEEPTGFKEYLTGKEDVDGKEVSVSDSKRLGEARYVNIAPSPREYRHMLALLVKHAQDRVTRDWAKEELASLKDVTSWQSKVVEPGMPQDRVHSFESLQIETTDTPVTEADKPKEEWEGDFATFSSKLFRLCGSLNLPFSDVEKAVKELEDKEAFKLQADKVIVDLKKLENYLADLLKCKSCTPSPEPETSPEPPTEQEPPPVVDPLPELGNKVGSEAPLPASEKEVAPLPAPAPAPEQKKPDEDEEVEKTVKVNLAAYFG